MMQGGPTPDCSWVFFQKPKKGDGRKLCSTAKHWK